jgi:nickel/cobalt transporter (NiCoT) family protein
LNRLCRFLGGDARRWRGKAASVLALIVAVNIATWIWALAAFRDYPALLGTALLAYSFGLRHAVDADHIAAIDNVVRKFIQTGRRPVAVGLYFSLGHSTVVVGLCIAMALAANILQGGFHSFKAVGEVVGTGVSAGFLFAIAFANLVVLKEVYGAFCRAKAGEKLVEGDLEMLLSGRGFLARLCRGLFRLIGRSWHMYPLGLLFGLGFDTATEVGLLGISASGVAKGLSIGSVLIFPALFTAGMTLADTADNFLMLGTYGWAFANPVRKLYYNLTVTLVSVIVALLVGGLEALGLLGQKLSLDGGFWGYIDILNGNLGSIGYLIIGIFLMSWIVSAAIYRLKRYDYFGAPPLDS